MLLFDQNRISAFFIMYDLNLRGIDNLILGDGYTYHDS
jgi:hypothetical protein